MRSLALGNSSAAKKSSFFATGENGQVRVKNSDLCLYHAASPVGFKKPCLSHCMEVSDDCDCATQLPQPIHKPERTISFGLNNSLMQFEVVLYSMPGQYKY